MLNNDVDVIFSDSSILLSYLKFDKIKKIEEDVINNCDLVLYASDWAANGAKKNYKINNISKIKVVPFGYCWNKKLSC